LIRWLSETTEFYDFLRLKNIILKYDRNMDLVGDNWLDEKSKIYA